MPRFPLSLFILTVQMFFHRNSLGYTRMFPGYTCYFPMPPVPNGLLDICLKSIQAFSLQTPPFQGYSYAHPQQQGRASA